MAIAIPTTTVKTGTGITAITTSAFTPPDQSLVAVMCAAGWSGSATPRVTMTVTDSGSHTWTAPVTATGTTSNGGAAGVRHCYFATSPGSITVTITYANFGASTGGTYCDVWVLTGAAASQTGAATASSNLASSTDGTLSITTTKQGSLILGIGNDATNQQNLTANGNTTKHDQFNDATDNVSMAAWYGTNFTVTPGAITVGGTWAAAGDINNAALEILPATWGPIQVVGLANSYH